jgi:Domain of unknown function (DUF3854)
LGLIQPEEPKMQATAELTSSIKSQECRTALEIATQLTENTELVSYSQSFDNDITHQHDYCESVENNTDILNYRYTVRDGSIIDETLLNLAIYTSGHDGGHYAEFLNYAILGKTRARFHQEHRPHDYGQMTVHLNEDGSTAAIKPEFALTNKDGKLIKYLRRLGQKASPTLAPIPAHIQAMIEKRLGIEIPVAYYDTGLTPNVVLEQLGGLNRHQPHPDLPGAIVDGFWGGLIQVLKLSSIPYLVITEGDKKNLCVLSFGHLSIAISSHTTAFDKATGKLHQSILTIIAACPNIRIVLALDKDVKPKAKVAVFKSECKIANALIAAGVKPQNVGHLEWDEELGKGIDDVLTNIHQTQGYEQAEQWLDKAIDQAPSHHIWLDKVRKQSIIRSQTAPIPTSRATRGGYLPEIQPIPGLNILDSSLGSGKTTTMINNIVVPALHDPAMNVVWLTPTNALGLQTSAKIAAVAGDDLALPHTQDFGRESHVDIEALQASISHKQGMVGCWQARHHLPQDFYRQPLRLVLDEAGKMITDLLTGGTYGSIEDRINAIFDFKRLLSHAAQTGGVYAAQNHITRHAIEMLMEFCQVPAERSQLYTHRKDSQLYPAQLYTNEAEVRSMLTIDLLLGNKLKAFCTSRMSARCLKREMEADFPDKKIMLLHADSENLPEFLSDPDEFIKKHRPDLLILTPAALLGVSIDIRGYFYRVYGFCSSLTAEDHTQGLERVREPIERIVYTPHYIASPMVKGFSIEAIKAATAAEALRIVKFQQIPNLDNLPEQDAETAKLQKGIDDYLAAQELLDNTYRSMGVRSLEFLLEQEGHQVEIMESSIAPQDAKDLRDRRRETRDQIWQDDAQFEDEVSIDPNKHTEAWARQALRSSASSLIDKVRAAKVIHQLRFPGMVFDAFATYKLFYQYYGKLARGIERRVMAMNPEVIGEIERLENGKILESELLFYRDLGRDYLRAYLIKVCGIMNLHDSRTIYSRSNPVIQELCEFLMVNREYIHVAFGWTYSESISPVSIINDLFNYLGIKVQTLSKISVDGRQEKTYQTTEDTPLIKECLESAASRLQTRLVLKQNMEKDPNIGFRTSQRRKTKTSTDPPDKYLQPAAS